MKMTTPIANRTPVVDPIAEFPKVEKMIYDQAWKFARSYPYPTEEQMFQECKSVAYHAFVKSCYDYNPSKGMKYSSWCYYWVWCDLKTFITKRSVDPLQFIEIDEDLLGAAPSMRAESMELVEDLSEDAREMVTLIVDTPSDLLEGLPTNTKQLMDKVKKYMIKRGKSKSKVEAAHRELEIEFRWAWT